MMFDKHLMFSEAQDLSQAAGTYTSTNVVDLGASGTTGAGATLAGNMGLGEPVFLSVHVVEAFASGGAATVDVRVIGADNEALTTNPTTLVSTGALAYGTLTAGARPAAVNTMLPPSAKRYLGISYVIAGATTTAGTITAGLVTQRQSGGGVAY